MAEEYRQGMVSQLLWGDQEASGAKLASLFTVPAAVHHTQHRQATSPQNKKKKREAASSARNADSSPPEKKSRNQVEKGEAQISSSAKKGKAVKKASWSGQKQGKKGPTPSAGFNPPPGVVHEALAKSNQHNDDEDSDDETLRKGIKEDKRPRRDRLKKANEMRTIFVGNVPLATDKKNLRRLFKQFGEIESMRFRCAPIADPKTKKRVAVITKEFHDKRHNISAYICFKEKESAKKALTLNGHLLDGFHLRVDSAKPSVKKLSKKSVFIGNLPFAIEEESIRQHFQDCGEIENVRVVRDRKTNLGKGFCYIQFKSADSVTLALHLKDSELEKRKLRVERCVTTTTADGKGHKMKQLLDRKCPTTGPKLKHKQMNRNQLKPARERQADTHNQKAKRKKKMWQPTNTSATRVSLSQRLALKKKKRKVEKKRKQKSKADHVSRALGPVPQLSLNRGPKKGRAERREQKGGKKGKKMM